MQTKLGSFIEAIINILIGAGIAFTAQVLIFPLFGIHVSHVTNLWITFWFTWISIVRSYCVRRWFNAYIERVAKRFGKEPEPRWEPKELLSWVVKGQEEVAALKPEPAEEARVKFERILEEGITEPFIKRLYYWNRKGQDEVVAPRPKPMEHREFVTWLYPETYTGHRYYEKNKD